MLAANAEVAVLSVVYTGVPPGPPRFANFRVSCSTAPTEKWLAKKYSTPTPAPAWKKNAVSAATAGEFSWPMVTPGWRKTAAWLRFHGYHRIAPPRL